jgi:hypothetical protein
MPRPHPDTYPSSLAERLERERRRRSYAVPGSSDDEDARMEALFLERELSDGRPGARWPAEEPSSSWSTRSDAYGSDVPTFADPRPGAVRASADRVGSEGLPTMGSGRHPA